MKHLVFDEEKGSLKGFFETLNEDTSINGKLISVDEFPTLTEGTTLQLNNDGTWGEVALPIEAAPAAPPDPEPPQTP